MRLENKEIRYISLIEYKTLVKVLQKIVKFQMKMSETNKKINTKS